MTVEPPTKHFEKATGYDYLSVIGAALYICGVPRTDCRFAIRCLARHSKAAGAEHVEAFGRLVSYMHQTRFKAITYRISVNGTNIPIVFESGVSPLDVKKDEPMSVFVDSDFAGTDGRSTAGYVVFLNGGPVIQSSKLMKVAATSSGGKRENRISLPPTAKMNLVSASLQLFLSPSLRPNPDPTIPG